MGFPTLAFAGHRCVSQIMDFTVPERLKDRQMVVKYYSKSGQARFHGGSQLKSSQSYPAGFMATNKSLDGQKQDLNAVCHRYTLLQIGKILYTVPCYTVPCL